MSSVTTPAGQHKLAALNALEISDTAGLIERKAAYASVSIAHSLLHIIETDEAREAKPTFSLDNALANLDAAITFAHPDEPAPVTYDSLEDAPAGLYTDEDGDLWNRSADGEFDLIVYTNSGSAFEFGRHDGCASHHDEHAPFTPAKVVSA